MASLDTRPDGYAEMRERIEKLERRQAEDERQFKAIAKRLKNLLIAQGVMILAIGTGLTGIKIAEEYQQLFVGLLTTGILGAPLVALAKDPDEEPPRTPEELEE